MDYILNKDLATEVAEALTDSNGISLLTDKIIWILFFRPKLTVH